MAKTIIVVSALVDSTIRDGQPDTTFILRRTLDELAAYIETTPVRAQFLYFTKETLPHTNTSLSYLTRMLEDQFLKVDKVCYVTEPGATELPSIRYVIEERGYTNWEIVEGRLTREFVTGVITGELRTDSFNKKRRALYRVPRDAYVRDRLRSTDSLEEAYVDDEQLLQDIPPIELPVQFISTTESVAEIVHIVGEYSEERTALVLLAAQYLALSGKTLLIEKDCDYHMLTEFVTKAGIPCKCIFIKDILEDCTSALEAIRTCTERLICVVTVERTPYSYAFLSNFLYNNLSTKLSYFISEDDFSEAPSTSKQLVCIRASVVGTLSACEQLDNNYVHLMRFVGVNLRALPETRITNGNSLAKLLSDVLDTKIEGISILNVSSLKIGGEDGYDLRGILGTG